MSILTREGSVLDRAGSSGVSISTPELLEKIRNDLHQPQKLFFDNSSVEILGL